MQSKFRGTGVALVTPFNTDGSIDYDSLQKLVDHVIQNGVNYVVSLGTTGESVTLTKEEKKQVLKYTVETVKGRVPVVAGFGGNNTAELLENFKQFDFTGIDAILSVSPYYNKPTQEGIYLHYKAVDAAAPRPIILYNVPGRTSSNITAATTLRIAEECKKVIGIKEASGNMVQCMEIVKNKPANFLVISGDDVLTLPFLSFGMDGVISVVANALPKDFAAMVQAGLNGNFSEATKLHMKLLEIMELLFADGNPGGVKAALEEIDICKNELRLPLAPVNDKIYQQIKEKMSSLLN